MTGCWPPSTGCSAEEGFRVVGAHEVLTEAVGPLGQLGAVAPDAQAMADIARGVAVVRALGASMSARPASCSRGSCWRSRRSRARTRCWRGRRGWRGRDMAAFWSSWSSRGRTAASDLPTLGPRTVSARGGAGLRGVAFEAGGTILVERDAMVAAADRAGLFLLGIDPNTGGDDKP